MTEGLHEEMLIYTSSGTNDSSFMDFGKEKIDSDLTVKVDLNKYPGSISSKDSYFDHGRQFESLHPNQDL